MGHRHPSFPSSRPQGKKKRSDVLWKDVPDEANFRAAATFMGLSMPSEDVARCVTALRAAGRRLYNPHDLLRAARLKPAKSSDLAYEDELAKVEAGEPWSPVLLVARYPRLIVGDGYHRISVAYDLGEQPVWALVAPFDESEPADE